MENKNITKFPKGFFQKERPIITTREALKDVIPVEWVKKEEKNNSKKMKTLKKTNQLQCD